MSQVLVWKSDVDGRLFEDKAKYTSHLRKLARERTHARKIQQMRDEREDFIKRMGNKVKSFAELEQFIATNWNWFFLNGLNCQWSSQKQSHKDVHTHIGVSFTHMSWSDSVSNSHSCPRAPGYVTNWAGREVLADGSPAPRGYPGWRGNVRILVRTPMKTYNRKQYHVDGFGSDYFNDTTIFTGTGGGGGCTNGVTSYNYDVRLYAVDFPALAEARERAIVWNTISDTNTMEFA